MPTKCYVSSQEAKNIGIDVLFQRLESSIEGLSSVEAENRLKACGPNTVEEKKSPFFSNFSAIFGGRSRG